MGFTILHSADWHIGQTLNGWSRGYEHACFFSQLREIVEQRQVDALIIAGDVFDNQNPSAEAMRHLFEVLHGLRQVRPHLTTVMVAGNHDPAGRLEAPALLLQEIGVHVCGGVNWLHGKLDPARHLVALRDGAGVVRAQVVALPFPRASDLPSLGTLSDEGQGSPVVRAVHALYDEAAQMGREAAGPELPLLATGHLHVQGGEESEASERRILVGGEHAVPASAFCDEFDYVALGHLHKPQRVGRDTIRYSGSPFPLSVSEQNYKHGVSLLRFQEGKRQAEIEHVLLPRPVAFHRIGGKEGALLEEVAGLLDELELASDVPVEARPFLHVNLAPQTSGSGLRAELEQILSDYPVRGAGMSVMRKDEPRTLADEESASLQRLAELQPEDLFLQVFEQTHGVPATAAHTALFRQVTTENEE
ncbi:exonuclease SbcCD subunit D [Polycladidibacter hongkongensis]|uniref:exonuclease SbcCD subunit D n=1 Tax=Polycladidibacter hongkongensis TaxID=1647556 RepID=UPI0008310A19|nr:exonuclease SbcCD subunit D [Pseudovibrio hongkongensis]